MVVIAARTIWSTLTSVNHSAPSGPVVMPAGLGGAAGRRREREFGNHSVGGDAADLVGRVAEPQRAVRPRRDEPGKVLPRREREFGDYPVGSDAPDLLAGGVGAQLGEPQRTVRPGCDFLRPATARRKRKFSNHSVGGDAPDLLGKKLG